MYSPHSLTEEKIAAQKVADAHTHVVAVHRLAVAIWNTGDETISGYLQEALIRSIIIAYGVTRELAYRAFEVYRDTCAPIVWCVQSAQLVSTLKEKEENCQDSRRGHIARWRSRPERGSAGSL